MREEERREKVMRQKEREGDERRREKVGTE